MAWYHVGGCSCPMGCCDCGSNEVKPKTQRDLLIQALGNNFDEIDKSRKALLTMQKNLDNESDKIKREAYKKANEIIKEAERKATLIIKDAKTKSSDIKKLFTKVKTIVKKDKLNKKERVYLYRLWDHMDDKEFSEFLRDDCKNGIED